MCENRETPPPPALSITLSQARLFHCVTLTNNLPLQQMPRPEPPHKSDCGGELVREGAPDCSCHTAPHLPSRAGVLQGSTQAQKPLNAWRWNWTSEKLPNFEERRKTLRLKKKEENTLRDMRVKQKGESKRKSIVRTWWDGSPTSNFWEASACHFN